MNSDLLELNRRLTKALQESSPAPVVPFRLDDSSVVRLDLSIQNQAVAETDYSNSEQVAQLVEGLIRSGGGLAGIGGYGEKRGWYARGEQFSHGSEIRSIHLGVDIWAATGTPVHAPYDATIHSLKDNDLLGDYGPTIVLSHTVGSVEFYSLYGHLSRESLCGKMPGDRITKGAQFAEFGAPPTNGDWPPHLHFQIILDMLGGSGDFPGVAAETQRERFLTLCPDPNLILRCELLR